MKITENKLRHVIRKIIRENAEGLLPDKPLDSSLRPTANAVSGIKNMSDAFGANTVNCLTIDKLFTSLSVNDDKDMYGNMMYSLVEYINNQNLVPKKIQISDILFVDEESYCEPNEDGFYSPSVMSGEMNHTVYDYIRTSSTSYTKASSIGMTGEVNVPLLSGKYNHSIRFLVDEIEFLPFNPSEHYGKFSSKNEGVKILERFASAEIERLMPTEKLGLDIGNGGLPPFEPPSKRRGGGGGGGSDEVVYKVFFTNLMGFGIVFVVPVDIS